MIELQDVHKAFGDLKILKGLTLTVPKGSTYVIMGRSGTGKSVTLKHVIGILKPDRGKVLVGGLDVPTLSRHDLMELRKRMGYLFQSGALINWQSVFDNVALPLREHSDKSPSEINDRVMDVLKLVSMENAAEQLPADISGGMKLRVGFARALVTQPEYVLYDEPNAGLDPIISEQVYELIIRARDDFGVTGLVVTHSKACACTVGDRIGVVDEGVVVKEGTVEEMQASDHELVRHFMGGMAD